LHPLNQYLHLLNQFAFYLNLASQWAGGFSAVASLRWLLCGGFSAARENFTAYPRDSTTASTPIYCRRPWNPEGFCCASIFPLISPLSCLIF
jgi:hypothetical protein